ncbi:MAG: enoyl ACP reductase FabMG family protein [Pseudobdellovibrionaceae bacterium]
MSSTYHAIRLLKKDSTFKQGDVLVLFGELFSKGYANGLVDEAERRGMKIIRTTVGRREKDGQLRPLNAEEMADIPQPFINVPLEAGFDLELDDQGHSPVDYLKEVKLSEWEAVELNKASLEVSRKKGRERFQKNLRAYLQELETHIPNGANVLFAHLMAGGVPRAKIIMPLMNRAVKGSGDRYLPSEKFTGSSIGQFCLQSFLEVTAETFHLLVNESAALREKIQKSGGKTSYVAYGYHGTEVLMGSNYVWQSYSPYVQGWAKIRLENYSREFSQKGIKTCVYNCPEILTNSSAIFSGVEVALYPLLGALKKDGSDSKKSQAVIDHALSLLKPEVTLDDLLNYTKSYLTSDLIREHCEFEKWPQHSSKEQMEKMLAASDQLFDWHKDPKQLMTFGLSEVVFEACGKVMLADSPAPEAPVAWINHDVISKIHSVS